MKKINILGVLVASLLGLFASQSAAAQDGPTVIVDNRSGEMRRVCFHRIDYNKKTKSRKVRILAVKCLNVDAKKSVTWDRKGDKFELHVKLYRPRKVSVKKPRLLHTLLASGRVGYRSTIQYVELKKGKEFRTSGQDERGTRFILKVCNKRTNERVVFALAFGFGPGRDIQYSTQGWWTLRKGECKDVPVSEMLFNTRQLPYGYMPWTYFYARTFESPQFWRGDAQSPNFCINERKKFWIGQTVEVQGNSDRVPYACKGTGEAKVRFRLLQDPDYDKEYYFLNF